MALPEWQNIRWLDQGSSPVRRVGVGGDSSRFRSLIEKMPLSVTLVRDDGIVIYANDETANLTGYDRLEIEHREFWLEAVHPEDAWKLTAGLRGAREGDPNVVVFRFLSRRRGPRLAEMHLFPSRSGNDLLVEAVTFDVTERNEAEEALFQSEALYRTFLEQSPIGMLHLDAEGTVTFENHQFRQIVGEEVEDAWIGRSIFAVGGLDERLAKLVRAMLELGEPLDGELISYRRSASRRQHLKFHGSPIQHPDGGTVGAVMMVEDRTDDVRRRAELQLRNRYSTAESALRKEALSDTRESEFLREAARILGECSASDRAYVMLSNASGDCCTDRAQWNRTGVDKLPHLAIMHDEEEALEATSHGEIILLDGESTSESGRELLAKSGAASAVWMPFWEESRLAGFLVIERIAERSAASLPRWTSSELELLQQLARLFETLWSWILAGNRYRHITATIEDCLFNFTFDEDGERRYLFLTPQIEMLSGRSLSHLLSSDAPAGFWSNDVVFEEDRSLLDAHDDALREGHESRAVYRIHHSDGSIRWLREHATSETDPMGDVIVSGILTDVTEQKVAENVLTEAKHQAESANRLKSAFIATMSHEIRTPMGAVSGFAELLARELAEHSEETGVALPPPVVEFLDAIQDNSKKLLVLVNDLFDLSNLEEGSVEIRSVSVSVNDVAIRCTNKIADQLAEKGVELRVDLDAPEPVVIADPQRLEQVLDNLLSNAVKFTDDGSVTVRTRCLDSFRVRLDVSDTGIGIAEDYRHHLFEPFAQEDSRLNRAYEGSGLGLSLAKRLLNLMEATIEVESRKGIGSSFHITLPAAKHSS